MDTIIRRALTGTTEQPALTFERTYRATPSEIRSACTSPERLARWLGEIDGNPTAVDDTYTARLSHEPDDYATGRVLRCDDDAIAVTWTWVGERESVVSIRIARLDEEHTTLTLHHQLTEAATAVDYGGGWEHYLTSLATAFGGSAPETDVYPIAAEAWRTITRAPLAIERTIPAPIGDVWSAFATADGLKAWWWSHWSDVEIDADVKPGGRYRITSPGVGITLSGTYLDVTEPSHLAYTWRWSDSDGETPDEAVDIRFEPVGGETRVIVRHTGPWADDAPAENYRQGWQFTLDQLTASLSSDE